MMKTYHIRYHLFQYSEEEGIDVLANNKEEAYDLAVYGLIPDDDGHVPYSAWVESVTYNNGNYHTFNTSEGNAY